ncbi:MAG TPA: DUF3572 domain-containing protein [Alphaproteobacteria bacterium]|jgi:hypothetical protein|nr:DUF3572 domain-containing protein [Alphaproteobacteria bacterium]HAM46315.1 DUF3572 domain-containing protein [Alphaproteobacteria bacterium]HBA42301.1 DUF3572 domain-containing protein [Alphaproteobacteria bacterium]HBC53015.1 DUF3572 domain-containing protein [Alphaproteobacteria bacterium]HBF98599.1 DUF3572 domain-containing protein [Alphaproteobacteria bacterium]
MTQKIREWAQSVALQALTFILSDTDHLGRFMDLSGLSPADLENRIDDPELLGGILDYLLMNEADLLNFCEAAELSPEQPAQARAQLPGGGVYEWT